MLTIAICTYRRPILLKKAIESVLNQWDDRILELLIIDNNSKDTTKQVVEFFQKRQCQIRYIIETTSGVANVRNRAILEAQGEYLIFLDDDATAEAGWLAAYLKKISPQNSFLMGKVQLGWNCDKPPWINEKLETLLAKYDRGNQETYLSASDYLITANLCCQLEQLKNLGGFNPNLGHIGRKLLGGEDLDLFHRIYQTGDRIKYLPDALVTHAVQQDRVTRTWFIRRIFWEGMGNCFIAFEQKMTKPSL